MLQLGKWLDHQKTETSRNILEKYFSRFFSILNVQDDSVGQLQVGLSVNERRI